MTGKIVIVAGSPGAGKSTVLAALSRKHKAVIVNLGTLMLEAAKDKRIASDRDGMRYLSNEKLSVLRKEAMTRISKMGGHIIIDTHTTIGENGIYMPGFPTETLRAVSGVSGLIYIDATPKDIIERRKGDSSRRREDEDEQMISNQRQLDVSMLAIVSSQLNVPVFIVINRHGQIERTVDEIKRRLDELFGA
jgi:adenylate kinase